MIAALAKPASRTELLLDSEYFATELIRRLERLGKLDDGRQNWQQAAAITRRIRGIARVEIQAARAREKRLAG